MTTTDPDLAPARSGTTTLQKVGLVLCVLNGLSNVPSVFLPPTGEGEVGPPLAILAVDSVLGIIAVVAAIMAWRGNAVALRIGAGATIIITLTSLPAFFVDVPAALKAVVAFGVLLTVVIVALMFSGRRAVDVRAES